MVRITNTGETVTDLDLEDEALDLVAKEHGHTSHAGNPTTPQSTPNDEDDGEGEPGDDNADTADNGSNVTDDMILHEKKRYLSIVKTIGARDGAGKKALLNFAETVVEGAMNMNAIVPDDAKRFYKAFRDESIKKATMDGGIVPVEANADEANSQSSFNKQVDKLKSFIKLGNDFKDDDRKATDIVRRARDLHIKLMATPAEKALLKYKSTYAALYAITVAQRSDAYKGEAMSEDEMRSVWQGAEPKPKNAFDKLEAALAAMKQARKGKKATDADPGYEGISDPDLDDAIDLVHRVIAKGDPDRADKIAKADAKADKKLAVATFRNFYRSPSRV